MTDTFGRTSGTPLAFFDPDTSSWRTLQDTLLWDSPTFSVTLPRWGMTRGGVLFERPTPAPPTSVPDSSSWLNLPTPQARDFKDQQLGAPYKMATPRAATELPTAIALLPTPIRSDYNTPASEWEPDRERLQLRDVAALLPTPHAGLGERGRDGVILNPKSQQDLQHTIAHLLPTPVVNDMGAEKDPEEWDAWAARQKAADGRPAPHGRSLWQEAVRLEASDQLLPTPRAQNGEERNMTVWERPLDQPQNLENALARIGESTTPPSDDGKPSPDLHQPQLFQDETTDDA